MRHIIHAFSSLLLAIIVNHTVLAESKPDYQQVAADDQEIPQTATVKIVNNTVIGEQVIRFTQGGRVEIHWLTDRSMDIHLHGYDIELTVNPGSVATMAFDLRATGRFPVTVHTHSHSSGNKEQTLVYVEVYPK